MSCLTNIEVPTDYVDLGLPTDLVHAELLKQAVSYDIPDCINAIIDVLNGITGADNKLADGSVYLRMLAAETQEAIGGFTYFWTVDRATTGNITLSGEQSIDGAVLAAGSTVLVRAQDTASENGIYTVAIGAWTATTLATDGNHHVWVRDGDTWAGTSHAMAPGVDATAWQIYFMPPDQTLDADTIAALAGSFGTPSATNVFVTDTDPRLVVFTDTTDGLVPQPGATGTANRFLCEDGTWTDPSIAAADGAMYLAINNVMDAAGKITFPDTVGITGLAAPVAASDAATKGYADTAFQSVSDSISSHVANVSNPHSTGFANIGGMTVTRDSTGSAISANSLHRMLTAGITASLPASPNNGTFVYIYNSSVANVNVSGNGNTLEGEAVATILPGERWLFIFDSTASDWVAL